MHWRIGFIISVCGMVSFVLPLAGVLSHQDFLAASGGFAFVLLGIFIAIESLARHKERKKS